MSMEELDSFYINFFLLKHWGSNFVNSKAESILHSSRFLSVFLAEFILTEICFEKQMFYHSQ